MFQEKMKGFKKINEQEARKGKRFMNNTILLVLIAGPRL